METLKTRIGLISMLFFLLLFSAIAQPDALQQEAFSASYKAENEGDYSKSIEALRKVYQEDSYPINLRLGWLTYMNGSFNESMAYYNKAIQLMPYSIEARLGLALPASAMGNWEQVIKRYKEILRIDPNHYLTNYRIGNIYYYREDYQTAHDYFERIANMYPFDYDAIHMFAWVKLRMGKSSEARILFNKALLIRPEDPSSLEGLTLLK